MGASKIQSFRNYIGGEWIDSAGLSFFESVDPATDDSGVPAAPEVDF